MSIFERERNENNKQEKRKKAHVQHPHTHMHTMEHTKWQGFDKIDDLGINNRSDIEYSTR